MNILNEFHADYIYTRYAVDEMPSNEDFCMHIHDQYEIFLFISGDAQYLVEGSTYQLQPYDVMIMRPSESHSTQILRKTHYERYVVNFRSDIIKTADPKQQLLKMFWEHPLGKNNRLQPDEFHKRMIYEIFQNIALCKGNHYQKKLKIQINLFMLLDLLCDLYQNHQTVNIQPPTLPEQILSYVNEHLFENISISMLAKHFYISPSHFSRIFKQAAGAAPWEYILLKRLTSAKAKIRSGTSVTQAAAESGFNDYSSFYRAYIKTYGCSPRRDTN